MRDQFVNGKDEAIEQIKRAADQARRDGSEVRAQRILDRIPVREATPRFAVYTEKDLDMMKVLAVHEAAHAIYYKTPGLKESWEKIWPQLKDMDRALVSDYGASSPEELFAEAYAAKHFGLPLPDMIDFVLGRLL